MTTISSIDARFAQDQVGIASRTVTASVSNLVSGTKRDANVADLSVGTILATRVSTLRVTVGNAGQAKSLLETAKGALDTVLSLLQQQKNLAVKSADDSLTDNERGFLNQEFQAIVSEINRISENANFNGKALLDGSISGSAGIDTSTTLSTDNYSLISAAQYSTSTSGTDTIATGDLLNVSGVRGEVVLTFADTDDAIAAGTTTFTFAKPGDTGTHTLSVTTSAATTNTTFAAAFVTAAKASTDDLVRNFTFTDTGDGSVIIRTREANANANSVTIGITTLGNISANSVTIGGDNIDTTGAGSVESISSATTSTVGVDGIASFVDANRIGETRAEATIAITTAASNSEVIQFTIVDNDGVVAGAGESVVISFTADGGTSANEQIRDLLAALNDGTASASLPYGSSLSIGGTADATERVNLLRSFVFELDGPTDIATAIKVTAADNGATNLNNVSFHVANATDSDTLAATVNGNASVGTFGTTATQLFTEALAVTAVANSGAVVLTIVDVAGNIATAGQTVTISYTTDGSSTVAEEIANLATIINTGSATGVITGTAASIGGTASTTNQQKILDALTADDTGGGTANITSSVAGLTFQFTTATGITAATLGGGNAVAGAIALDTADAVTATTVGADRTVTDAQLTYDQNIIGQIDELKATFNAGSTDGLNRNSVTFTAKIGDTTYISEPVFLHGVGTASTIGAAGNLIRANEKIVFYDADGKRNASDVLSDNGFVLNVGTAAISLADTSTISKAQDSLDTIATNLKTQLDSITVNQARTQGFDLVDSSSSDFRIASAVGTLLDGLEGLDVIGSGTNDYNEGDVRFITDGFSSVGTLGSIESFTVDRLTDTITTTIDGETYTAYLNSVTAPTTGGVRAFGVDLNGNANEGSYDSTNKIIDLDDGNTGQSSAKLHFFSDSTTDGRVFEIDLGNVKSQTAQIDISTADGERALADALNAALGVSANDSLSFQVGASASDTIGVSIGSAKTTTIYKDDDGDTQTLSVATSQQAIAAGDIIDNAINNVVSLISDISAKITAFNSAIQNNQASIQNADAARSKLLDTDYTQESTRFAESRVRVDAATAVLTQVNSRIQNLLGLLQQ
ncbi:MAG: flagellin [Rickettsiales bacterium]|nr:flagellin [Pseudomonadota bacterium]MDA0966071.1 flagellin [Pseudomonadota bacterium]MDG4544253.1 flagellin [Rickettsiales bacterium]MDG4546432.1 flagellin [Rickettsiales bacterium]MDG4548578.1 flagellin [Rickettsiales bacterium]